MALKRVIVVLAIGGVAACGGSGLNGKYGGDDCAYELTFGNKDTVYVQILGFREVAAQYRVDGDKIVASAPNWGGAVFTRKGDTLESTLMGQKMVCRKLSQ